MATLDRDWVQTNIVVGNEGDSTTVVRTQDVQTILDHNKAMQNDGSEGYGASRELRKIASIPLIVIERWAKEDGVSYFDLHGPEKTKYLRKKLNDPDNRFLKTIDKRWN